MFCVPSISGLFKWRQFEPEVILLAVGWYLRFSLSYREVEELLAERGLWVDHVTVWRWVQRYETYIRIKGKWRYLYRAVDSSGATLDFQQNHPAPRVINTDGHAAYPPAIAQLKSEGTLDSGCQHRPVPYLNNVLEQDHRAIKRRVNASQGFRSFWAAWRTLAGYEVIHMIRKGQACGSAPTRVGLLHHFILGMFGIEV